MEAHGWTLFAHPLFLDQIETLIHAVEIERTKHPERPQASANAKLLAAIARLAFDEIPSNPGGAAYRHGGTLGPELKHWYRAKFGNGRFRLFFRFRASEKIIVYAWVNDAESLRTYGGSSDAYALFRRMLYRGNPPDDWDALLSASKGEKARARAQRVRGRLPGDG